jgi:phosphomannomutase/phosphoglucomutase
MAKINPFIFREYDIRGVVGEDLTDEVVELLGKGLGTYFARRDVKAISLGGDVRLHTKHLSGVLQKGILSAGIDIIDLGAVPTGVQYFSLYKLDVQGG